MKEVVVVCCYKRPELLYCCLKRVREAEPMIPILLFPDRGTSKDVWVQQMAKGFNAQLIHVGEHNFYGNSYNAGEALRLAYNMGFELTHYLEEDAMPKPDLFKWTREQHEQYGDVMFCSAGWIFNQCSPLDSGDYFAPWLYIPQFSIGREKLALIVDHLSLNYYFDMIDFILKNFGEASLNKIYPNTCHYEIDGLIQRVLVRDGSQVRWPSVAKVEHIGFGGYNRGGYERYEDFFGKGLRFDERVERVEQFIADPHWRMEVFGRELVEREIGHPIPKREYKYTIKLPGGWETVLKSELKLETLPRRIHSVDIPADAEIVVSS